MRLASKNIRSRQRGVALVEMALMLPVLAVLLVGIVDFGLILREHQILQNAAREGARFSSLQNNRISTSTNQAATITAIKDRVVGYLAAENITVSSSNVTINQSYPITTGGGMTAMGSEISVTYSRALLFGGGPLWPFGPATLTGRSVFRNLY